MGLNIKLKTYIKVLASIFIALIFMLTPFPVQFKFLRPEVLMMTIIYWVLAAPNLIGVATAWALGLLQDIFGRGILLGQNALALATVAYLAQNLRHRLRLFAYWQQAISIFALVGLGQLIILMVQWLSGNPARTLLYWLPSIVSVLCWPLLIRVLRYAIKVN